MGYIHRLASHTKLLLNQNEGIRRCIERIGCCQRTSHLPICRYCWTRLCWCLWCYPICWCLWCLPIRRWIHPSLAKAADAEVVAAAPAVAAAPVAVAAAPVSTSRLIAAPALPQTSQFQSQDEFGNLAYGYANHNSAKQETGNTYGGVTGSYSYTDANGLIQTVNYIADGLGFRVQATNLPVAPVAELAQPVHEYTLPIAPVFEGVAPVHEYTLPEPVKDTPEVAAAKAEFQAAFDEAASREKRSTPAATTLLPAAVPAALPYAGYGYAGLHGLGYAGYPYAAPVAAATYAAAPAAVVAAAPAAVVPSAPAARAAVKTVIKNNPGFAESYIVN